MHAFFAIFALLAPPEDVERSKKAIRALVRQLGDDSYKKRQAASKRLTAIGEPALPELRRVLNSPDPEVTYRLKGMIRAIMIASGEDRSAGMTLALIDPGDFLMGSQPRETGRRPDETQHHVRITKPFLMGRFEVTQQQFREVMKFEPSWFSKTGGGKAKVGAADTRRYPVDSATWFDAVAFCNALSKLDGYPNYYRLADIKKEGSSIVAAKVTIAGGNGYRLPTESEWEYACRAGTEGPYHYQGSGNGKLSNVQGRTYTGYGGRVKGPNLKRTTTVGSYKPNAYGLYDMHGNVAEWCQDWYARSYPTAKVNVDPRGPASGYHRVLRGGSWLVNETSARSAARLSHTPRERKYYTGFRVARTP